MDSEFGSIRCELAPQLSPVGGAQQANDAQQQQQQPASSPSEQPAALSNKPSEHANTNQSALEPEVNGSSREAMADGEEQEQRQEEEENLASFSTAFTISFGDDTSAPNKRQLGIKDSIRKFAPPKPHTIEKPRERRSDCADSSLASIESAPAGLSKHFHRRGLSASTRSACPAGSRNPATATRNGGQNVNDCVALLIDRMLSDQKATGQHHQESTGSRSATCKSRPDTTTTTNTTTAPSNNNNNRRLTQSMREVQLADEPLGSELDFCEEHSDNGTYIVGADSESEAARKKIDELFGVVKSAEASVLADNLLQAQLTEARQSRLAIKKLSNKERQEHINRVAPRHPSKSRSSSSSHREAQQNQESRRPASRQSNHSSAADAPATTTRRHRRSVSQSSRHSSNNRNHEPLLSDADTRSSRSSLHNEPTTESLQTSAISSHPNIIKFNRTFDLRRKRLGLGEPSSRLIATASSSATSTLVQQQHSAGLQEQLDSTATSNHLTSSQRRNQINSTNTYKSSPQHQSSSRSANFCREDGGRFSLRMKNMAGLPPRSNNHNNSYAHYATQTSSNKSPQQNPYDSSNYVTSKVSPSPKHGAKTSIGSPMYNTPSAGVPYQSGDELEQTASSSSRYKNRQMTRVSRYQASTRSRGGDSEGELESHQYGGARLNCSLGQQQQMYDNSLGDDGSRKEDPRVCNSASKLHQPACSSDQFKPGLNSLMISSISSLSLKICHSVCDVLVELSKKLPVEDDTRLILEEIMPEVKSSSRSPTSLDEIESPHIYLARTLKNFRRIEQMVAVMNTISSKIPPTEYSSEYNGASSGNYSNTAAINSRDESSGRSATGNFGMVDTSSDQNS